MKSYNATTGLMSLGTTAADSAIMALVNPADSGVTIWVESVSARLAFVGTPAATGIAFGVTRAAVGTMGGGSGSKTGSSIAKKRTTMADSAAAFYYGPTPITGLTDDTPGDFATTHLAHQVGSPFYDELIEEIEDFDDADPIVILPGTALVIRNRTISIAGSRASFDIAWAEVAP